MKNRRPTEQDLLKDLSRVNSHADELAEPLPHELEPLERLKGSEKKYERPLDPSDDWDAWFAQKVLQRIS